MMKQLNFSENLLLSFIYLQFALIPLGPEVSFASVFVIFLVAIISFGFNNLIKATVLSLNNNYVIFQFSIVLLTLASALYGNTFLYTLLIGFKSLVIFILCAKTAELYALSSSNPNNSISFKDCTKRLLKKAAKISAALTIYLILINWGHKDFLLRGTNSTTSSLLAFYLVVNLSQLHLSKAKNLFLFLCFLLSIGTFSGSFFLSSIVIAITIYSTRSIKIKKFLKSLKVVIGVFIISIMMSIFLNFNAIIKFLLLTEVEFPFAYSSGRFLYWNALIKNYHPSLDYLIFGNGFGSEQYFLESIKSLSLTWLADAHNAFISTYFGLGILGVTLLIAMIVSLFIQSTTHFLSKRSCFQDVCIGSVLISHFILCFGTNSYGAHFTVLTVFSVLFLDRRSLRLSS